jgi:hypothetical protein
MIILIWSEIMETKYLIVGLVVLVVAIGGAVGCGLIPFNEASDNQVSQNSSDNESNTNQNESSNDTPEVQGTDVCVTCDGKGYIKCGTCDGTGIIKNSCSKCGGDGTVYIDENGNMKPNEVYVNACHVETCPACGGTGGSKTTCGSCGGDGKVKCNDCGGDGKT